MCSGYTYEYIYIYTVNMCASQSSTLVYIYILKICVRASFLVYGVGARFGPACVCERKDRGIYVLKFYMSVYIYCKYVRVPRSCTV